MNAKKVFKEFANYLNSNFPEALPSTKFDETVEIPKFEETFLPEAFLILKKDEALFSQPRVIFGVNVGELFMSKVQFRNDIWKHIQTCLFAAFMGDNIKDKIGKILNSFKSVIDLGGHNTDEIDKIIDDQESQDKIGKILEYLSNTRLCSVMLTVIETIDLSELDLDVENLEDFLQTMQNIKSNPALEKIMLKLRDVMQEKLRKGDISQSVLVGEIETMKVMVQEAFGDIFNDMIGGGRKAEVAPKVLLSNSPDARRARMVARLQRKMSERSNGKK